MCTAVCWKSHRYFAEVCLEMVEALEQPSVCEDAGCQDDDELYLNCTFWSLARSKGNNVVFK